MQRKRIQPLTGHQEDTDERVVKSASHLLERMGPTERRKYQIEKKRGGEH